MILQAILHFCTGARTFANTALAFIAAVAAIMFVAGCGDPPEQEPPPEEKMLKKLDSDNPDTFLEGVDEAGKKYGKTP